MTALIESPSVGLHRDIPFEQYQQIKLVNSGAIGWGMCSMKHMKAAIDQSLKDRDTKDRKFGRAVHCILLEPDSLDTRFVVALPCQEKLKTGDRKGEQCGKSSLGQATDGMWVCGTHAKGKILGEMNGFEVISPEDDLRLHRLRDSMRGHKINQILHRAGWSEVTAIWERNGVMCKGRLDRFADGIPPLILDVKKCQTGAATRQDCESSITNYGWHRQSALYVNSIDTITGQRPEFCWVMVDDNEPFDVNFLPADDETLAIGLAEADRVLAQWKRACEKNEFCGYITDTANIQRGGLAEWYRRKFNEDRLRA